MSDEWRAIDTHPGDSDPVIGGGPDWANEVYYETERGHEGWYLAGSHWTDTHEGQCWPTHYQPMPAPPSAQPAPASKGEAA